MENSCLLFQINQEVQLYHGFWWGFHLISKVSLTPRFKCQSFCTSRCSTWCGGTLGSTWWSSPPGCSTTSCSPMSSSSATGERWVSKETNVETTMIFLFKSNVDTPVENKQRQNVRTNKDDLFVKILCTGLCSNLLHSFFAQVLRAHKLFLSACSPWFQKVLITILIRPHSICADMSSLHYDAQCHNTRSTINILPYDQCNSGLLLCI